MAEERPAERPGEHWRDPARVRDFLERNQWHPDERQTYLGLLARLIPFPVETPLRVLDLGAGYGAVAATVLDAFPNATATLVDMSEAMIEAGKEQMAPYAGRYRYVLADLGDGHLPAEAEGPFEAAVSAIALQYVPAKRTLFKEVAQRLTPGGCFLDVALVGAPDPALQELYNRAGEQERLARGEPAWRREPGSAPRWERHTVAQYLELLREAGFERVDCFWKRLGTALIGGYRSP
jgi:tRNA (cmo5U34)-methyltransferase